MNRLNACLTQLYDIKMSEFTTSVDISEHPLLKTRKKTRLLYFAVLEYLTKLCTLDAEFADTRLSQYRTILVGDDVPMLLTLETGDNAIKIFIDDFLKPWKNEYSSMLLCDAALIIIDETAIKKACGIMSKYLNGRKREKLNKLLEELFSDTKIPPIFAKTANLIMQFRANQRFISQQVMRVMVTGNMSAGKSTLINALIGKPITRTSQEACIANLCYLYNKSFEDNLVHLVTSSLNLNATHDDLLKVGVESMLSIALYFRVSGHSQKRICLIDTPGVNSALNRNHGKLTRKTIVEENYDKLDCFNSIDDSMVTIMS